MTTATDDVLPVAEPPQQRAAPVTTEALAAKVEKARLLQPGMPDKWFLVHLFDAGSTARMAMRRLKGRCEGAQIKTKAVGDDGAHQLLVHFDPA